MNVYISALISFQFGPTNPFRSKQMSAPRNMLSGYAEPAHVNDFMFEQQRRTFSTFGYALDPSVDTSAVSSSSYIGAVEEAEKNKGLMAFETGAKKTEKRKKVKGGDASDIDSFLGPYDKKPGQTHTGKNRQDEQKELDEILAKRQKRGKNEEEAPAEEKTVLHVKDAYDYQGRSYLHVPQDVGINLRSAEVPDKCYLPKKQLHVWTGHTKGVSAIRLFPVSGHLLLSCSMDCKIKLWEVYNDRRCVRTFIGHSKAVRDVSFNNSGTQFLSAAYDRYLKKYSTQTLHARFTNKKVPYCVKFNPDEDKQQLFVAGMSDKKIVQVWEGGKWLACQSMDNQILIFGAQNRFRLNKKKIFKGHMVAGLGS
ncbi:pre-mRNA-processing factor 17-like [Cyprinus carpio]|uniref:Pre-mRNA-processing factor 17-like n=1 Tax=Cyprinus carpio TaxID=7962 RepID=A0A9Q9Z913_CYPCA|nr:pre-mRNA-processing factor 17-like [Cyprinus carpio]